MRNGAVGAAREKPGDAERNEKEYEQKKISPRSHPVQTRKRFSLSFRKCLPRPVFK